MSAALYDMVMDNPMAAVKKGLPPPIPVAAHECPCCGAIWEQWEDCGGWQHDSGFVRYSSRDPISEECCPICATNSAPKDVIVAYIERKGIMGPVMSYVMLQNGEGRIEPDFVPRMWELAKQIAPDSDFWTTALEFIGEYNRSDFYEYRKEMGA